MKIHQAGAELLHVDGSMDIHTEANSCCIELSQERERRQALENDVLNLWVA